MDNYSFLIGSVVKIDIYDSKGVIYWQVPSFTVSEKYHIKTTNICSKQGTLTEVEEGSVQFTSLN